jgi:Pentapeptide repeats (8 copies)
LAQILGGFAVLIGAYFAWRNLGATARSLELTNQNLELTKEGQVTERFTKAIEQLRATDDKGNPKLKIRCGGIYALERIAHDFEKGHWPIMEVLTAYVRQHAQWKEVELPETNPITTDIEAILTVIRRREWHYEKSEQTLDLHRINLHDANLEGAYLRGADLTGAYLRRTNLRGVYLRDAHLKGADLWGADLEDAYLSRANMEGAYLRGANLINAYLRSADLWDANLRGAYLRGADLKGTLGVTQEQINSAIGDATTKLPAGLTMPELWKRNGSG